MRTVLTYQQRKLASGAATFLYAGNFLKETARLTLEDKEERFHDLTSQNVITDRNVLHLALFYNDSTSPEKQTLIGIARETVKALGFARQPYLVYQHRDTGNPHLHIVSTNIRPDGSRIDMHNIQHRHAQISKELGVTYGLGENPAARRLAAQRPLQAGVDPSFPLISEVLKNVIDNYRYRSLDEFNAILALYNITADPGKPDSRLRLKQGLLYRVITDKEGPMIHPIKASAFSFRPTLTNLYAKFENNHSIDPVSLSRVRNHLRPLMAGDKPNPADALRIGQLSISRQGSDIYIVDLASRVVVTPRDLGAEFTAESLGNLLEPKTHALQQSETLQQQKELDNRRQQNLDYSRHL
jgi:hypothetical protein